MGPIQTLDEFLNLLFRRALLIAVVALIGTVLATLFALETEWSSCDANRQNT